MQTRMSHGGVRSAIPGLALVGVSVLWGSSWIVLPLVGEVAEPFAATALLFATATVALAAGSVLVRIRKPQDGFATDELRGPTLSQTLLLGLFLFLLPTIFLIVARRHGASGWVPFLYAFLPLGLAFVEEAWSATMVVAVGAVLVLLNGTVPFALDRVPAAMLALVAVVSQGYALCFGRKVLRGKCLRALLTSLGVQCFLVAVTMGVLSFFFDKAPRVVPWMQWQPGAVLAFGVLGVFATAIPYAVLYWLLAGSSLKPYQLATTQWLQTLVFSAESAWFARIVPPWLAWVAAGLLIGATVQGMGTRTQGVPVVFEGSRRE